MKWISCDNSRDYLVSPRSQQSSISLFIAGDDNLSVSDSPLSPLSPSLLRSTPSPKVRVELCLCQCRERGREV